MFMPRLGCLIPLMVLGCSGNKTMGPSEFTEACRLAIAKHSPQLQVSQSKALELSITGPQGNTFTSQLDRSYARYQEKPTSQSEIITEVVESSLNLFKLSQVKKIGVVFEPDQIIPIVVGPSHWQTPKDQQGVSLWENFDDRNLLKDQFVGDLVIHYAKENEKGLKFLRESDLGPWKISKLELRSLACQNLKKKLIKRIVDEDEGVCSIQVGGDFESSFLLFDGVWEGMNFKPMMGGHPIKGDLIVAVPARDRVLVTGTEEHDGIHKLQVLVEKYHRSSPFPITTKIFIRRDGKFSEWKAPQSSN